MAKGPSKQSVRVEGVEEAKKAFHDVARDSADKAALAEAGGEALIPSIVSLTRYETGALAAGWGVTQLEGTGAAFINTQDYWTFQEFGTEHIEPMDAIGQAWARHEDDVIEAYDKAIREVAADAGF